MGYLISLAALAVVPTVAVGDSVRLNFQRWPTPGAASPIPSATPDAAGIGTVSIRALRDKSIKPVSIQVAIPGSTLVELPSGDYVVDLHVPGWWMSPRVLSVTGSSVFDLTIRRMAIVEGTIPSPDDERRRTLLVRFDEFTDTSISGEAQCAVAGPAFRCEVPEGTLDLRLALTGHVPHYRWGMPFVGQERVSLGPLRFTAGASLSGYLRAEEGSLRNLRLKLTPVTGSSTTIVISPTERGFFIAGPLAPDEYTLQALKQGLVSAPRKVSLRDGFEAHLREPLLLAKPRRVEVMITPVTNPIGTGWVVQLTRPEVGSKPVLTGTGRASLDGSWSADNVAPGDYELTVRPEGGPVWHSEQLSVGEPVTRRNIAIHGVRFRGTVRLGDEPLASAEVIFGGQHGAHRIPWKSNERGEFQGFLPEAADTTWSVTVRSETPQVATTITDVTPRTDSSTGDAVFEIVLPSGSLEGEVVGEKGVSVANALVTINSDDGLVQIRSDAQGEFHARGLSVGKYAVSASQYLTESDTTEVELRDDDSTPPHIRLELKPYRQWTGRVTAPDGRPVAGSKVFAMAVDVPITVGLPARTDREGRFAALVPASARLFDISVAPPGYAYSYYRRPYSADLELVVDPRGGTLLIDSPNERGVEPFMWHRGSVRTAYSLLSGWSASFDESPPDRIRIRVPQIEPGDYTVCLLPSKGVDYRTATPTGQCKTVYLAPYAEEAVSFAR